MTTVIKFKKSTTVSSVPTTGDLEDGEIAVNVVDKKIYIRNGASIVELANVSDGGGGGGGIEWQSLYSSDGSSDLNATSNYGYFIDTNSGPLTINLPSSPSAGDTIPIIDATGTSATNSISVSPNGNKIFGSSNAKVINKNKSGYVFVYSNSTRGWLISEAYSEPDAGLLGTPGAPTIGTATVAGTTAFVSFTAPIDDGGSTITGYTATSSPGGVTGTLSQAGSGTIEVSGLGLGTTYTFTVTASNVNGTGEASASSNEITTSGNLYIEATGGTITTSGDYKIHTFTGDGCFIVTQLGTPGGSGNSVSYVVVAGGGAGGTNHGGSGGAGGFREGRVASGGGTDTYTVSPLDAGSGVTVTAGPTTYPVTVGGGGGAARCGGSSGSPSTFSTITSTGGGRGGGRDNGGYGGSYAAASGQPGGSGGGASTIGVSNCSSGGPGTGNTPPVSPSQGNPGHPSGSPVAGGRGGSASAPGGSTSTSALAGVCSSITGSAIGYSSSAGAGGFSQGSPASPSAGNRGGSGYGGHANFGHGGSGSKGVVIIRYKYQ